MPSKKIEVQGLQIRLEQINDNDYLSITDIIKNKVDEPKETIRSWIKNTNTVRFLWAWEEIHNPNFKGVHLHAFIEQVTNNRYNLSPSKWIKQTDAVGLVSKRGRHGGGTYAHKDIALEFCSWFDPYFKVYLMKEFQRLKEEEAKRLNLDWHINKVADLLDEARNVLDIIPGQENAKFNRLIKSSEEE